LKWVTMKKRKKIQVYFNEKTFRDRGSGFVVKVR